MRKAVMFTLLALSLLGPSAARADHRVVRFVAGFRAARGAR